VENEWARSSDWSPKAREGFEEALRRARSLRPQYLHMKALALEDSGDPALRSAATELFQRELDDPQATTGDVLLARQGLARLAARRGELEIAEDHLRQCTALEADGNVSAESKLALAELLLAKGTSADLVEARELLESGLYISPAQRFRAALASTRLMAGEGFVEQARNFARQALAVAEEDPEVVRNALTRSGAPDRDALAYLRNLARSR